MTGKSVEVPVLTRLHFFGQSIFQFLLAVFVTSTIYIVSSSGTWNVYTWHEFLTITGFAFFMAEAISFLNEGNGFLHGTSKKTRNLLHGFFMILATVFVVAGISIEIQAKTNNGSPHFQTVHGKLGLSALILTLFTFLGGIVAYFSNTFYKKFGVKPLWVKVLHNVVGCSAYLIGNLALAYGVYDYLSLDTPARKGLVGILGIYVIIGIILGPVRSLTGSLFGGVM